MISISFAECGGADISHWQGTDIDWDKMISAGIKFIYLKSSQGISFKDDCFETNYSAALAHGMAVGAYHFVTTDNALSQYQNFYGSINGKLFDLPPALDCEYYTAQSARMVAEAFRMGMTEPEVEIAYEFRWGKPPLAARMKARIRSYAITTYSIVDSIGMRLTEWITGQPKIKHFQFPAIYTNASSGNAIFLYPKTLVMNRYPLWIANWKVQTPYLPKIWQGKSWLAWQDGVVDGSPYGIAGSMDHNVWGSLFDFPNADPEPPDPDPDPEPELDYIDLAGVSRDGVNFSGRITEVKF